MNSIEFFRKRMLIRFLKENGIYLKFIKFLDIKDIDCLVIRCNNISTNEIGHGFSWGNNSQNNIDWFKYFLNWEKLLKTFAYKIK